MIHTPHCRLVVFILNYFALSSGFDSKGYHIGCIYLHACLQMHMRCVTEKYISFGIISSGLEVGPLPVGLVDIYLGLIEVSYLN